MNRHVEDLLKLVEETPFDIPLVIHHCRQRSLDGLADLIEGLRDHNRELTAKLKVAQMRVEKLSNKRKK